MRVGQTFVLLIDDEPDKSAALEGALAELDGMSAVVVEPEDVTPSLLEDADVVAIDEFLTEWPTRDAQPLTRQPIDGLAVAAILRGHTDRLRGDNPAAVVVLTGQIDDMGELPTANRESLLASQHSVEWVFRREDPRLIERLSELAQASYALNGIELSTEAGLVSWLALHADPPWRQRALNQISQCRPPRGTLASLTHGRSFLRWFLQRVIPYPTFLLSDIHAAVAARLDPATFLSVVESGSPLADRLNAARYDGQLASFSGRRWWRAGVRSLLEELAPDGVEPDSLAAVLSELHGGEVAVLRLDRPVITQDEDQVIGPTPIEFEDAVRILPEGWPPFADDAWADASDMSPELEALVLRRIEPGSA